MAVGVKLGSITDEIGTDSFLGAFFDTITGHLEPEGRGTRFPAIAGQLYAGELTQKAARTALAELNVIESELAKFPPSSVIWNIKERSAQPPWGSNIAPTITNLSNYFVTSTGRDLMDVLREVISELRTEGGTARIVSY